MRAPSSPPCQSLVDELEARLEIQDGLAGHGEAEVAPGVHRDGFGTTDVVRAGGVAGATPPAVSGASIQAMDQGFELVVQ